MPVFFGKIPAQFVYHIGISKIPIPLRLRLGLKSIAGYSFPIKYSFVLETTYYSIKKMISKTIYLFEG